MKRETRKHTGAKRRAARQKSRVVKWIVGLGTVALIVYGISQMSNVAYGENQLPMIDFSDLTSAQKHAALEEANEERCPCGCGMTLAQCVATDSTCPLRETNVERIKTMVREADRP